MVVLALFQEAHSITCFAAIPKNGALKMVQVLSGTGRKNYSGI